MSNEYKEWAEDRKEQAWEDIIKIAEIFERDWYDAPEERIITITDIEEILVQGGWINDNT